MKNILIFEESQPTRQYLADLLEIIGFKAHVVSQKTNILTDLNLDKPDLVLLGSCTNPAQIKATVKVLKSKSNCLPIIWIADGSDRDEMEIESLFPKENTCCLPANFDPDDLKVAINRMIKDSQASEYVKLKENIIGESPAIAEIRQNILRLSQSDITVLITGESGTGKDFVAKAIHDLSPRAKKPFIKVNSAALPDNLIESELFGYEKGAFTGAWRDKPGKFILAQSGTLLLDEIGEISLHLQPKLLQVLEDKEVTALGSTTNEKIDVRVMASTSSHLLQGLKRGTFRSDLYYRLNMVSLNLPPLRKRTEDIAPLCKYFLKKHAALSGMYGHDKIEIKDRTIEQMCLYPWPGNVRELENCLKSFFILGNKESFLTKLRNRHFLTEDISNFGPTQTFPLVAANYNESALNLSLKDATKEAARKAESDAILEVLSYTRWNRRKSADLLKISYNSLLNKIKEYEIEDRYKQMATSPDAADDE